MKPRFSKDFARAVSRIRSETSEAACAEAVGRSTSLVRKWADPDNPAIPNLDQALALDRFYSQSTGKKPPILDIYTGKLTDILGGRKALTVNLTLATLSVQSVVGQLSNVVAEASKATSEQPLQLSNYNRDTILGLVDKLQELSDLIEDSLEQEFSA